MAAVCHLGCLKKAFHMPWDPIFCIHTKFGKNSLISGGEFNYWGIPKIEIETIPGGGILLPISILTCVSTMYICVINQNFRQMTHRPESAANAPFPSPSSPFLSQCRYSADPETQNWWKCTSDRKSDGRF